MNTSSPLAFPISNERPWQAAYIRYRELEQQFSDRNDRSAGPLFLLRAAIQGRHVFDKRLKEYRAVCRGPNLGKLPAPPDELMGELQDLAALRSSYDTRPAEFVFEDVYHLAFHMLTAWRGYGTPILPADDCPSLYRGQRKDSWEVGAKIYRGLTDDASRAPQLHERAAAACRIGHAIAVQLGFSFVDAMAVAQHYSAAEILGTPTWLVDFSRDPWVALFFASDGGETGDLGVVWSILRSEYSRHAEGTSNPIGPLQLIVPSGVARIDNQAGVFVIAGLPQIFDQYVAFGYDTRFRQYTGLRFEDTVLGISGDRIYPPDDPLLPLLSKAREAVADCVCGHDPRKCDVPPSVFTDPMGPATYAGLLTSWLHTRTEERPDSAELPAVRQFLPGLARFHARLHSGDYARRLPRISSRSLNRLRDAFGQLCLQATSPRPISLRDAIESTYVNHVLMEDDQAAALREVLSEILHVTPVRNPAFRRNREEPNAD